MKVFKLLFIALLVISCNGQIDTKLLVGNWRIKGATNSTNMTVVDTMTFSKNGSVFAVTYADGKLATQLSGNYKVDPATKIVSVVFNSGMSFDLDSRKQTDIFKEGKSSADFLILELTKDELELQNTVTKRRDKYVRY